MKPTCRCRCHRARCSTPHPRRTDDSTSTRASMDIAHLPTRRFQCCPHSASATNDRVASVDVWSTLQCAWICCKIADVQLELPGCQVNSKCRWDRIAQVRIRSISSTKHIRLTNKQLTCAPRSACDVQLTFYSSSVLAGNMLPHKHRPINVESIGKSPSCSKCLSCAAIVARACTNYINSP